MPVIQKRLYQIACDSGLCLARSPAAETAQAAKFLALGLGWEEEPATWVWLCPVCDANPDLVVSLLRVRIAH